MISFSARVPIFILAVAAALGGAQAAEPAIIAKARAFLGTEAALNAIKSVHYTGTVTSSDPADPAKQTRAEIEIIVQKPDQQRVVARSDKTVETTALDGYEGWQRTQEATGMASRPLIVFKPDAVKRLRAQAWENVSFFRGIEGRGGRLEGQGTQTVDGIACEKIAFIYAPNIIFYRYFDTATGRLVLTETEDGGTTREEGETMVEGVRFPKGMQMTLKGLKGQTQTVNVSFDKVSVNETFPPELFRMPSPASR
jgi:outer membrane lipoprotein-sorting protein